MLSVPGAWPGPRRRCSSASPVRRLWRPRTNTSSFRRMRRVSIGGGFRWCARRLPVEVCEAMARPPTPWSVVRVALGALASGSTQAQAAELAGISERTMSRLVVDHGVPVMRQTKTRASDLTIEDREAIYGGIVEKVCDAEIARRLGRHRGTVGREIGRNGGRDRYRPHRAQAAADERARRTRPTWIETRRWLWDEVVELIRTQKWSPEQIANPLRKEHPDDAEWRCPTNRSTKRFSFTPSVSWAKSSPSACGPDEPAVAPAPGPPKPPPPFPT